MQGVQRYRRLGQAVWARTCSGRDAGTDTETPLRRLLDEASAFGEGQRGETELQWATQPYAVPPPVSSPLRDRSEHTDPRDTTVLLFPGQGSQRVGMGLRLQDIPAARELYDLASNVVGWDVWSVCTGGPDAELEARCQTCVVVTSLAALELVREQRPAALQRARAAAGFSLGEVAALVFAGSLPLEQALRLVELRTAAMRAAAAERPGAMLTLWLAPDADLGRALHEAREHAATQGVPAPVCQVANYLYPGCKVIAGDEEAVAWVERHGAAHGVRRAARVRVSGAFHTPLMARAAQAVGEAARLAAPVAPRLPVVSGATGRALRSAGEVARALGRAVAAPVRWEQTLHALYARPAGAHFPLTLALGPGGTLRATLRQVNARAWDASLQVDV